MTLLVVSALSAQPAGAELINRILATVDGDPVTLYELKQFMAGDVRLHQAVAADQEVALEALITNRLIEQEAEAKGIVVGEDDVDRYITGIRQRNQITEEQLAAALTQQDLNMDTYRAQIHDELRRAQLISREIRGKVTVTPEDIERYYEAHIEDYATQAQVTVSHIVLQLPADAPADRVERAMEEAERIHDRLDGGADFAELAKAFSEDAAAKSGGLLGSFKAGDMLDALEEAVQGLEPGEFSHPVRSDVGVHIVRLDGRTPAAHQPLEELAEEIKELLYNDALEQRYARWLKEDLRKRHHVEIHP